jgi:hypothetical protein
MLTWEVGRGGGLKSATASLMCDAWGGGRGDQCCGSEAICSGTKIQSVTSQKVDN